MSDFSERYGPWAVIAGASEGVGAVLAHDVAELGLNVLLLARRPAVLEEVAGSIRASHGVEARTLTVDLAEGRAVDAIAAATADLEVGLLAYCAGADPDYTPFLDKPVGAALSMVQRNCTVPLQLCHHFAPPMVERGRGGIVLLSSGGGLYGGPRMVAYGASKAFDIVMAEGLWSELRGSGVDVLALVLGMTDTPALRRLLTTRGVLAHEDDALPEGVATAEEVSAEAIANLANGPTWFVGEMLREGAKVLGSMSRREAVEAMAQGAAAMGED